MANILVRDLDEEVIQRLKDKAAADGKSMNTLLNERITEYANEPTSAELTRRFKALTRIDVSSEQITELVQSARP